VGDYLSIVRKGAFTSGDLVAYIPEQSILPDSLISEMGLDGMLAGKAKNRVKPIRLRGVLSQGLCYPALADWEEGQVVTESLGITKYSPPIPAHLEGEVFPAGLDRCIRYDIENIKRYPGIIKDGEDVVMTEKIHGTWLMVGVMPPSLYHEYGDVVLSSKGMSAQGLALIPDTEANDTNLYVRVARHFDIPGKIRSMYSEALHNDIPVYVIGEAYGVQDLKYGASPAQDDTLGFGAFDIFYGKIGSPSSMYLNDADLDRDLKEMALERCPVLYRGPFTSEILAMHTNGKESVSGESLHVREGLVVRPITERRNTEIGRVQLKSVSEKYLMRKDGTEFN